MLQAHNDQRRVFHLSITSVNSIQEQSKRHTRLDSEPGIEVSEKGTAQVSSLSCTLVDFTEEILWRICLVYFSDHPGYQLEELCLHPIACEFFPSSL